MNQIKLKGMIRNIEYSHTIGTVEYNKAELIVAKNNGDEDVLPLRFKKFSNKYEDGQIVELVGNIRSYSEKLEDGHNKVHLYVFTYFDIPDTTDDDREAINEFAMDGRICKIDPIRTSKNGKQNLHFILANNIISENSHQKLNAYLPCTAFGRVAIELAKLNVSDQIEVTGHLNSRIYKKTLDDGELELRTAYECIITSFKKL